MVAFGWVASGLSKRHNSTFVPFSVNRAKLTPTPSQVAPRGYGRPGQTRILGLLVAAGNSRMIPSEYCTEREDEGDVRWRDWKTRAKSDDVQRNARRSEVA